MLCRRVNKLLNFREGHDLVELALYLDLFHPQDRAT